MLSSFLKKLLFARQFFMIDGKIEVLGKRQVMLPSSIMDELAKNQKSPEKSIKTAMRNEIADYAKKVGGSEEGMLANITYIFETFGLGKLELSDLDNKNKRCIIRLHNPTLGDQKITASVLAGTFSFLFQKDVNAELKPGRKGEYEEFVIQ